MAMALRTIHMPAGGSGTHTTHARPFRQIKTRRHETNNGIRPTASPELAVLPQARLGGCAAVRGGAAPR
jgi:hypothetical protein